MTNLIAAEMPIPAKTARAEVPLSSPARSTSAHAVPSGYGSVSCSFTISAFLSGTINRTPSRPPISAVSEIDSIPGASLTPSVAHRKKTGIVKIAPAASDSPAEPIVCTMLLSSMDFLFRRILKIPMETTAAGIDAETVIPTRSPRYALAAPNTTARSTPVATDVTVNSDVTFSAGTYGLNSFWSFILIISIILYSPSR